MAEEIKSTETPVVAPKTTKDIIKDKVVEAVAPKVQTIVSEHVEEKTEQLTAAASTETVWYKKIGYYVAIAAGAVLVQFANTFGADVVGSIVDAITTMFGMK